MGAGEIRNWFVSIATHHKWVNGVAQQKSSYALPAYASAGAFVFWGGYIIWGICAFKHVYAQIRCVDQYLQGASIEGVTILLVEWVFTVYMRKHCLDHPLLQQACAKQGGPHIQVGWAEASLYVQYYSHVVKLFACFAVVAGYLGVEGEKKNAQKRKQMEEKIEVTATLH